MQNQSTIEYRAIPDYPGYRVGSDGSVWTSRRKGGNDRGADRFTDNWRQLKLYRANGYLRVNLIRDGANRSRAVHCLVLEAFVGPCPDGMECCHYPDSDRANNRLENLRWDTHAENVKDKYRDRLIAATKRCLRCNEVKSLANFYSDTRAVDGKQTECKSCHVRIALATRDPDKKRKANREWMCRRRQHAKV